MADNKVRQGFELMIYAWVIDYIKDEDKADDLTAIIMYHSKLEFRNRLITGFILGIITIFILVSWLS